MFADDNSEDHMQQDWVRIKNEKAALLIRAAFLTSVVTENILSVNLAQTHSPSKLIESRSVHTQDITIAFFPSLPIWMSR